MPWHPNAHHLDANRSLILLDCQDGGDLIPPGKGAATDASAPGTHRAEATELPWADHILALPDGCVDTSAEDTNTPLRPLKAESTTHSTTHGGGRIVVLRYEGDPR